MPSFSLFSPDGYGDGITTRFGSIVSYRVDSSPVAETVVLLQGSLTPRTVELGGSNFVLLGGGLEPQIVSGTVNSIMMFDRDSNVIAQAMDLNFDAGRIGELIATDNSAGLARLLLRGADNIGGTEGNDELSGYRGRDRILGGDGDDGISGGRSADRLNGEYGNDYLTGGGGGDTFIFDTALNRDENLDFIRDFQTGVDKIELDSFFFEGAPANGPLAASAFVVGSAATTAAHRVIFDESRDMLLWDSDGTGAAEAIEFALLQFNRTIVFSDIVIA